MTKKEKSAIIRKVLGYTSLGWFDHEGDTAGWHAFADDYFSRAGVTDGEEYSAKLNRNLSTVAMLQVLDEIHKRIQLIETDDIDGDRAG